MTRPAPSAPWRVQTPCPSCGSPLTTDGVHVWCAAYGPPGSPLCTWGLRMDQPHYHGMMRLEDDECRS